jgi:hypothetical protein
MVACHSPPHWPPQRAALLVVVVVVVVVVVEVLVEAPVWERGGREDV